MSDDLELVKRLRDDHFGWVPEYAKQAASAIERLTAEVAALKTEVKTANTRLEAEQWARQHVKSVIVSDLEKALSEAQAEAARLTAEVAALKHDVARHMQIANETEAEAARLREALEWYADQNNWHDQSFLRMDHMGRECEDYAPPEIYEDYGQRALKALRGEEGCPPPPPQGSEG